MIVVLPCGHWRMTQKGMSRNSCLVPYTLQPFESLTPEGEPFEGLGQRDEPFRALPGHALARICFDFVFLFSYLLKVMFENLFDQWHAGIVHIGPIMVCAKVGSMVKARAEPRLLGALRKTVSAVGVMNWLWMNEWNAFVRVSLRPESCSRKALENHCLFHGLLCFQPIFLSRARDFTTFTLHDLTDFYVERATAPHYNKLSFMFS